MPDALVNVRGERRTFRLSDFSKGENLKSSAYKADLEAGYVASAVNWYLSPDGSLLLRRGTKRLSLTSLGGSPVLGSIRVQPFQQATLNPYFLLSYSGSLWTLDDLGAYSQVSKGATVFDGFDTADGPLGSSWTVSENPSGVFSVFNKRLRVRRLSHTDAGIIRYTGVSFGNDQESTVFMDSAPTDTHVVGPFVRGSGTYNAFTGYVAEYKGGLWYIRKMTNVDLSAIPIPPGPGDPLGFVAAVFTGGTVKLRVTGARILLVVNGQTVLEVTDSEIVSGSPGVFTRRSMLTLGYESWTEVGEFSDGIFTERGVGVETDLTHEGQVVAFQENFYVDWWQGISQQYGYLDGSAPTWFTQWNRYVYGANGTNAPFKFDANEMVLQSWGISAPTTAPSAASGAAGVLNGTYRFKVTFVLSSGAESNPSSASNAVTVTNQQISLSSIPTSSAVDVAKRRIYGFKQGVSTSYQLVAEINDNVATTYTVTTDQDSWTVEVATDNDPPPQKAWISALWKNRVWMVGDGTTNLYYSKTLFPEAFPTTNYLPIPFDEGDFPTALLPIGDALYVFGNESVFYVTGDTPEALVARRTYATSGAPGPWAVDEVSVPGSDAVAVFLSRNGLMALNGLSAFVVSEAEEPLFSGIPPVAGSGLNWSAAKTATVKFYDRLRAVLASFPTGSSATNSLTLWWFVGRGFVRDSRSSRQFLVFITNDRDGKMFAWDSGDVILREWDADVYTDDGVPITATVDFGYLSGAFPEVKDKTKRWNTLTFVTEGAEPTYNVTASVDGEVESETFSMPVLTDGRLTLVGRRLKIVATVTASSFHRLVEVSARALVEAFRRR